MTVMKYYYLPEILKDIKTKLSQELGVSFIHKYDIFMTPCVIIKYYIGCDLLCKELHCTGSVELLSYSQSELAKVDTHFDTVYKEYATHWYHIMFISLWEKQSISYKSH